MLWLAGTGALAQSSSTTVAPGPQSAPVAPLDPIVNGRHRQPGWSDIMERQYRQRGQAEPAPPSRGPDGAGDKDLDELYDEVLKQSEPQE